MQVRFGLKGIPWYTVACCPTNIARIIASLGQYIYAEDGESVFVNMLISSSLQTILGETEVALEMNSSALENGKTVLKVNLSQEKKVVVKVRVPSYYKEIAFHVDGEKSYPMIKNGYAMFELSKIGKIAMTYGPYVYCLEEVDNGENLPALSVSHKEQISLLPPLEGFPGEVPCLTVKGSRVERSIQEEDMLYGIPEIKVKDVQIKAIPYALWCNREPGEMQVWIRNSANNS